MSAGDKWCSMHGWTWCNCGATTVPIPDPRDALLAAKDQEIERLRYRVRRLTTALRPFVRECDRVIRSLAKVPCKPDVPRPYIVIQIMRDDHRAAKAALLGSPRAGEEVS